MLRIDTSTGMQADAVKATADFLAGGGVFALLCVLVIGVGVLAYLGGRSLLRMLGDFLKKLLAQVEKQTTSLDSLLHEMKEMRRETSDPAWLRTQLATIDKRLLDIEGRLEDLRVQLAQAGK